MLFNQRVSIVDDTQWWDDDDPEFYEDEDAPCSWCGGEGMQDNDDPLWYGFDKDMIPCRCCDGTGLRSHQTIF